MIAYPAVAAGHLLAQQLPRDQRDTLYSVARCLRRDTFVGTEQHGHMPSYEATVSTGPTVDVTAATTEDLQRVLSILASRSVANLFVTTGAMFFVCAFSLCVIECLQEGRCRGRWCSMGFVLLAAYLWCLGSLCLSAFTLGSPLYPVLVSGLVFVDTMLRVVSIPTIYSQGYLISD
jgi:hypothetical protein